MYQGSSSAARVPDIKGKCREGLRMVLGKEICKKDGGFLVKKQCVSCRKYCWFLPNMWVLKSLRSK